MTVRSRIAVASALAATGIAAFAGCAGHGGDAGTTAKAEHKIEGTVSYRERIALPPEAELDVWIVDLTEMASVTGSSTSPRVAENKIATQGRQVPIPFEVRYDPTRIRADHKYAVRAAIRSGGETMFTTSEDVLVITQDHRSRVELWLERGTSASDAPNAAGLITTSWRLTELNGHAVPVNAECTLSFPEASRVAGKAACNNFFGTATISGTTLQLSQMGSTRMACPPEIMATERDYLAALQAAQRFTLEGDVLLVHTSANTAPLRFTRSTP